MNTKNTILRKLLYLAVVVVMFIGTLLVFNRLVFRITGTTPGVGSVSTISPFFRINFNHKLDETSLTVEVTPAAAVLSKTVSGTAVQVNWNSPIIKSTIYKISLSGIRDTRGKTLANKTYVISPKEIAFNNLSKDEQKEIIRRQSIKSSTVGTILTGGVDLQKYGVTNAQVNVFEQAVKKFSPNAKSITVDGGSIKAMPHDATSSNISSTLNFNMKIDGKTYSARLDYLNLTVARVYLYNNGAQVYDSQNIDSLSPATDY
jgi:hypothetical protein